MNCILGVNVECKVCALIATAFKLCGKKWNAVIYNFSELEQKRLEAAQYKLEGNALYLEGKTREALGNEANYSYLEMFLYANFFR